MTIEESKKIIAVMMVSYPNYRPIDVDMTVGVWADMLQDYTYHQVDMALKAYIRTDTTGFAPSIGQIVEKVKAITEPETMSEIEAWGLVSRALRNSSYNSQQEFDKLPPVIQKTLGSASQLYTWSQIEGDGVETVIQSNFLRSYRAASARQREISKMPQGIRDLIEKSSERVALGYESVQEEAGGIHSRLPG